MPVAFLLIAVSQFKLQSQERPQTQEIVKYRMYFEICDGMMCKIWSDYMMLNFCYESLVQLNSFCLAEWEVH